MPRIEAVPELKLRSSIPESETTCCSVLDGLMPLKKPKTDDVQCLPSSSKNLDRKKGCEPNFSVHAMKHQLAMASIHDMIINKKRKNKNNMGFVSSKAKTSEMMDFVCKKTHEKPVVVDDRMNISCDTLGKHHCQSVIDEPESPPEDCEKPRRRRSLSRMSQPFKPSDLFELQKSKERILHGKFREVCDDCDVTSSGMESIEISTNSIEEEVIYCDKGAQNPFMAAILRYFSQNFSIPRWDK